VICLAEGTRHPTIRITASPCKALFSTGCDGNCRNQALSQLCNTTLSSDTDEAHHGRHCQGNSQSRNTIIQSPYLVIHPREATSVAERANSIAGGRAGDSRNTRVLHET
jgi:hypothetical protein